MVRHYGIPAYLEVSKSKGWHVWIFMKSVTAIKARTVAHHILEDIGEAGTEVFPKQNYVDPQKKFGSYINSPCFGKHVEQGRTVFVDHVSFKQFENQWDFFARIKLVKEKDFDKIIEINDLKLINQKRNDTKKKQKPHIFQIYPCTKNLLLGVRQQQRSSAFRLAVHFKNFGFSQKITIEILKAWTKLNRPYGGRRKIKESGIVAKVEDVYKKDYTSLGCGNNETKIQCSSECPLYSYNMK